MDIYDLLKSDMGYTRGIPAERISGNTVESGGYLEHYEESIVTS